MFGAKLRDIRKYFCFTQNEMAKLLNISPRTYASYEREENNPPYSMLVDLCKNHNIDLNWFIANEQKMFRQEKTEEIKDEVLYEIGLVLEKYSIKKSLNENK